MRFSMLHTRQSYNRYTYALNNPLKYTDPNGYYAGHPPYLEDEFVNNSNAFSFAFTRYVPNYSGPGNYRYTGGGQYEEYVSGQGWVTTTFDEVFNNFIVPNSVNITGAVMELVNNGSTDITIALGVNGIFVTDTKVFYQAIDNYLSNLSAFNNLFNKLNSLGHGYGMMYDGEGGGSAGGGYQAGVVSQSEFHNAVTPLENIGVLGGYYVSFYTKTFQGSDGNWYAKTSATAFASHAEQVSDKVSYFGITEVIVGGEVISRSNFSVPSDNNSYFITQGHTWLGNAYNALPTGGNAQLRITISYNAYQFWNGHAYPANPYQYIINYP